MYLAGFVLVGGRSSRMGRDKARLPVESRLLVEDVAAKVRFLTCNVALIGEMQRYRDLPFECFDDLRPCQGPLAGIETALAAGRGEWNLIVACDMPNLQTEWLAALIAETRKTEYDCIVLKDTKGKIHPLCGIWRAACLPIVRRALDAHRLKVMDLLAELATAYVPVNTTIENVNTPEDWDRWRPSNLKEARRSG
jgi:molybdopterin-guanine dinucleotide biosynthesis protein A